MGVVWGFVFWVTVLKPQGGRRSKHTAKIQQHAARTQQNAAKMQQTYSKNTAKYSTMLQNANFWCSFSREWGCYGASRGRREEDAAKIQQKYSKNTAIMQQNAAKVQQT